MARIYVIDDHEDSREVAAAWLSGQGFDVSAFASAEEARAALANVPANLILTDVMLPGMSGTEFATLLRADPRHAHIPVIALTGRSDVPREPFAAVVVKPFEPDRLEKLMRRILTAAEVEAATAASTPVAWQAPVSSLSSGPPSSALRATAPLSPPLLPPSPQVAAPARGEAMEDEEYRNLVEAGPLLAWRSRLDGERDWFNARWLEFTGRRLEDELGTGWLAGVHPDDVPRIAEAHRVGPDLSQPRVVEHRLRRHDGVYRWVASHATARMTSDGRLAGFVGFVADIDARRALDDAKAIFLRMMAHELRTPLTPLRAYVHQLRRGASRGEVAPEELLGRLDRQVQRLVALVQHLGEAGRLVAGAPLISTPEPFDLAALLARVLEDQRAAERDARGGPRHVYEGRGFDAPAPLSGDERQLERAVEHVLSNAKKFSPDGGVIELTLSTLEDVYLIEVTDRGIGIPEDELTRVGRPYFRGRNAPPMNYPGVGLGLAMTSEILKAHGGRLEVERRPGGGTHVRMTVRRRAPGEKA